MSQAAGQSERSFVKKTSTSVPVETRAQIEAEILYRYHSTGVFPTQVQMTQIAIGILDGARSTKTVAAVKDWAIYGKKQIKKLFVASTSTAALIRSNDWLIAATEAKNIKSSAPNRKYEMAKKNAIAEAKRADSLADQVATHPKQ